MIKPADIYISREEFDSLILDAEVKFMNERAALRPQERNEYVQFWVPISPGSVPKIYIDELEESYINVGWSSVKVEFVNDHTTKLMVCLVP